MSLYVTGDVHSQTGELGIRIEDSGVTFTDGDALLILGDAGLKYGHRYNDILALMCSTLPCVVLVMRGNHDTRYWRDLLRGDLADGYAETVEWQGNVLMRDSRYPNVLYISDSGDLLTIDGHSCLAIPGAWSIDWEIRELRDLPFEPEEKLTIPERNNLLRLARDNDIEFVFSHTCPASWMPELSDLLLPSGFVPETDTDMEEWLDEVLATASPTIKSWYFGHFHSDRRVAGIGHLLYQGIVRVF